MRDEDHEETICDECGSNLALDIERDAVVTSLRQEVARLEAELKTAKTRKAMYKRWYRDTLLKLWNSRTELQQFKMEGRGE